MCVALCANCFFFTNALVVDCLIFTKFSFKESRSIMMFFMLQLLWRSGTLMSPHGLFFKGGKKKTFKIFIFRCIIIKLNLSYVKTEVPCSHRALQPVRASSRSSESICSLKKMRLKIKTPASFSLDFRHFGDVRSAFNLSVTSRKCVLSFLIYI